MATRTNDLVRLEQRPIACDGRILQQLQFCSRTYPPETDGHIATQSVSGITLLCLHMIMELKKTHTLPSNPDQTVICVTQARRKPVLLMTKYLNII
jgi:hypothetical protein